MGFFNEFDRSNRIRTQPRWKKKNTLADRQKPNSENADWSTVSRHATRLVALSQRLGGDTVGSLREGTRVYVAAERLVRRFLSCSTAQVRDLTAFVQRLMTLSDTKPNGKGKSRRLFLLRVLQSASTWSCHILFGHALGLGFFAGFMALWVYDETVCLGTTGRTTKKRMHPLF